MSAEVQALQWALTRYHIHPDVLQAHPHWARFLSSLLQTILQEVSAHI
jgi:hypothetical protein